MNASAPTSGIERLRAHRIATSLLLTTFVLLVVSCSFTRLHSDLKEGKPLGLVFGPVSTPSGDTDRVVVLLYLADESGYVLDKVDQLGSGIDGFVFPADSRESYRIAAFQDLDGNLRFDAGEPAGTIEGTIRITPAEKLQVGKLALATGTTLPADLPLDLNPDTLRDLESLPLVAGVVTTLDDPRFSTDLASEGMWQPVATSLKAGAGVYFLEPYDPNRIPVLFVHGIGGTPDDFRHMIENLDREKYQAWVFSYPSGARLHTLGRILKGIVRSLHNDLKFDHLYVTAHSMGGLVARSYILQAAEEGSADFIDLYISFCTPYNGHEGMSMGVKYLPVAVPSWVDLTPDGDFLVGLRKPLPDHVPFYLFFGYDTGGFHATMTYSSDSVISLRSQLDPYVQKEAVRSWGYNRDHVGILSDPDAFARYSSILDEVTAKLTQSPMEK